MNKITFACVFMLACMACVRAEAAVLQLVPEEGVLPVGALFSVAVELLPEEVAVNAVEGMLSFDPEQIAVTTIDYANSALTLWPQPPTFSNTTGVVSFGGVTEASLVATSSMLTVEFRSLRDNAVASIVFAEALALAADGSGVNVLRTARGGSYQLTTVGAVTVSTSTASSTSSTTATTSSQLQAGSQTAATTSTTSIAVSPASIVPERVASVPDMPTAFTAEVPRPDAALVAELEQTRVWLVVAMTAAGMLLIYIWYVWRSGCKAQAALRRETRDLQVKTEKIFWALRTELHERIAVVQTQKRITKKEQQLIDDLTAVLQISQELLEKEVADIEQLLL